MRILNHFYHFIWTRFNLFFFILFLIFKYEIHNHFDKHVFKYISETKSIPMKYNLFWIVQFKECLAFSPHQIWPLLQFGQP